MKNIPLILTLFLLSIAYQSVAQPGSPDLSFNKTGLQSFTLKTNVSNDNITASYLLSDGKLLVAGYYQSKHGYDRGFISRLTSTGEIDLSFGTNGRVRFADLGTDIYEFIPTAIALQNNGTTIVLAGYNNTGSERVPAIASLLPEGALDESFNGSGYKKIYDIHDVYGGYPSLQTVQVHPATGNIIAGGATDSLVMNYNPTSSKMLLVALTKTGAAFAYGNKGGEEYMTKDFGPVFCSNITSSVRFHADSMYLGVNWHDGDWTQAGITAISMVTGKYNDAFGEVNTIPGEEEYDDLLQVSFVGPETSYCHAIALTATGDILLAGYGEDGEAGISKVNAKTEAKELTFGPGNNGYVMVQFTASNGQEFTSIAVDQSNNIIAGGHFLDGIDQHYWAVSLLDSDGVGLAGFGTAGKETFPMITKTGITSIHAVGSNYLLVGDYYVNVSEEITDGIVKKINNTASNVAYGIAGEATVWATDYSATAENIILNNGKLWVCGNIYISGSPINGGIAVINASTGTIDASFGGAPGASPGVFLIPTTPYGEIGLERIAFQGNKLIVAATYFNSTTTEDELLLMRFNVVGNSLEIDPLFGSEGYALSTAPTSGIHRVQGLLIQDNGNIIVYGYGLSGPASAISVLGFSAGGIMESFGSSGAYVHPEPPTDPGERKSMDGKILSNGNMAFVSSAVGPTDTQDMLVFILTATGSVVSSRFYDLSNEGSIDGAYSMAVKEDQSLFVGGISDGKYAVLSLLPNGDRDLLFGKEGVLTLPNHLDNEIIAGLHVDKQSLVAVGRSSDEGGEMISALRFTLKGRMDSTFTGKGYTVIGRGQGRSFLVASDRLYVAGFLDDEEADMVYGDVYKLLLGTGPAIKNTILVLTNLTKTYGDAPFRMTPISNNPAPITYKINNGPNACATVDATGLIKILCATNSDNHIEIEATQAASPSGYSAASAIARIEINKAVPTLTFTSQGGIVGEKIKLKYNTNATGSSVAFSPVNYTGVVQMVWPDSVLILRLGEEPVSVTVFESTNYKQASATATIYGFATPVTPETADDNAELIYGQATSISINVLANDAGYTGSFSGKQIDLDPGVHGIQDTYISPSLGLFKVDTTTETVTYIPFSGFIGSGAIPYLVVDNRGTVSTVSYIHVAVRLLGEKADLEATELITPNNDNLNDAFVIANFDMDKPNNRLKIFDRNGQELFSQDHYKNDWRGELSNGKEVENGVYYFVFIEGGTRRELKGAIEVRR